MRHIDIRKKRPTPWPWAVGAGVLAMAIWGITVLLTPPEAGEPEDGAPADTRAPAAIPAASDRARAIGSGTLDELAPLGLEDRGMAVRLEAEVLATDEHGSWVLAGKRVIRFESRSTLDEGDSVLARGVLRAFDPRDAERMARSALGRHPKSGDWTLVSDLKLVATPDIRPAVLPGSHP